MTCLILPLAELSWQELSALTVVAAKGATTGARTRLEAPSTMVLTSTPRRLRREWAPKGSPPFAGSHGRLAANARDHTGASTITPNSWSVNVESTGAVPAGTTPAC